MPVIAGIGSNNTRSAIDNMRAVADRGARGALAVVPYYNKPNQEGLYAHFAAIAEACPLPIVVYNVPSRTVADISVETLGRLAKLPTIVAVKDATGNLGRVTASASLAARTSPSSPAMTTWRSASMRWAASAASASPPTSRPSFAPTSRMPASLATGKQR